MNKSQIFKAAHALAKSVHVAGDCYRVTFGAALKIVIAESKTPVLETFTLTAWTKKAGEHRIYIKISNENGLDKEFGYMLYLGKIEGTKYWDVSRLDFSNVTDGGQKIAEALSAYCQKKEVSMMSAFFTIKA
jgi:hypothetical protein